jgi:hypothetical protein
MASERGRGPLDRREFLRAGGLVLGGLASAEAAAPNTLPSGVRAVWDLAKAHREKTSTRERVCLNARCNLRWWRATYTSCLVNGSMPV